MKQIEQDIPCAIAALQKYKVVEANEYAKAFNGYIASFGASVIQSGLMPTVVFYSSDSGAEENRSQLLSVICEMLAPHPTGGDYLPNHLYSVVSQAGDSQALQQKILQKAIAIKLALRLFKKKGKDND